MLGKRLAHYEITGTIGKGGMGEVYRARDTKLGREVAIKVLPTEMSGDPERLGRFEREARTLATLQHPNIASIYGFESADHVRFLVMELVDGEDLSQRLQHGALAVDEVVDLGVQLAEGLAAAHAVGIVHRDLKPANIKVSPEGKLKVLDFGLARIDIDDHGSATNLQHSPTLTGMTQAGIILGTAAYMSPEQTRGKRADHRADIWAYGVVLFEMLTGQRLFEGETVSDTLAGVLRADVPWDKLPRATPPALRRVIVRCLDRDVSRRLQSIAEARIALEDLKTGRSDATSAVYSAMGTEARTAPSPDGRRWRWLAGALGIAVVVLGLVAAAGFRRGAPPGLVRRFNITMDKYQTDFGNAAISRDGRRILYSSAEGALMMRNVDDLRAKPVPGADQSWSPAFSPDSRTIVINTGFPGALKIIPLEGGAVRTLVADSTYGSGIAWGDDDWIYYLHGADYGRDLMRIRAAGGAAEFVARPDTTANALFFYWPQVLPNGRQILLTIYPITGDPSIGVLEIATGKVAVIARGVVARYSPSGHVLVVQDDGTLQAARFDASRGAVRGGFTTLAEGLFIGAPNNSPLTLSDEGTSVYQVTPPGGHVVRVSRDSGREEILEPDWTGEFGPLSLSPDGSLLAISMARGGRSELWVKSLGTGAFTKLSAGGTANYRPSWSPDGREVIFTSDQRGKIATYHVPADGGTPPARLFSVDRTVDEAVYSQDGQWLVFRGGSGGGRDIYAMRNGNASTVRTLAATPAEEFSPALSPDGRWLAYASDESGRTEVYVRPFPDAGVARYTVSRNGGSEPLWSHSGKELFFRDGAENLVAVEIAAGDVFRTGTVRTLFSAGAYLGDNRHNHYSVSLDDRSFFFVKSPSASASTNRLIITLNLFEDLERKVGQ